MSRVTRTKVFISYSHVDRTHFEQFNAMLGPAVQQGLVDSWDDTKIAVGETFLVSIQEALASAKVGVLLVSKSFINSSFIRDYELPELVQAQQSGELTIFWVCLEPCLYEYSPIVKFQAAHDVERPLNQLRKPARARVWKQICEKLIALLTTPEAPKPAPAPVRTRQDMLHPNATNQPRTHVVESTDGSVSRALRDAQPWDIILVRPGHYEGALVMDKPLEIIGDGSPEDIVIEVTGSNALLCRAPLGMVCNLTLRQLEGGEWFAVDIMTGRLMLLGCRVESDSLGGIAIHGPTAAPRIRHTCVRNCRQSGVTIFDHARGLLEDNEICSNQLSGVVIHSGADPVLRSNRVHSNRHVGIQVDGGQGRLEHNEIFDNGREGVIILNRGNPNMQSNAIHDNTLAGVFVCYSGQGTLEHNNIWSNKQSGIAITSGAQPLVRANRIYANNGKGVWCDPEAAGTVAANDLRGNIFGARWPSETEPHFNQTRFRDNLE